MDTEKIIQNLNRLPKVIEKEMPSKYVPKQPKIREKFTTIYVPVSLHKQLATLVLEQSIKTRKKIHIWEYISQKI